MARRRARKKAAPKSIDRLSFDSLGECAQWIESTDKLPLSGSSSTAEDVCEVGFKQAMEIARTGGRHATDVERLKSAMSGIPRTTEMNTSGQEITSDVIGFAPIVPNAMMGLPDSMLNLVAIEAPAPVIKIGVHVGRGWAVEESTVYYRAAALLAGLDVLHSQGYKTELWACWRNQDDTGNAVHVDVLVKPENAQWDYEVASFCFGNPAMQRRLFWACGERSGKAGEQVTKDSYGVESMHGEEGFDVYFPRLSSDLPNVRAAQALVTDSFADAGLTIEYT